MVLGPVAFRDQEDQIGVGLLGVLGQAPQEVGRVDEPRDIQDDDVAQGEGDEEGGLNRVVPVLEGRIDRQQHEKDQVEDPIKSEG